MCPVGYLDGARALLLLLFMKLAIPFSASAKDLALRLVFALLNGHPNIPLSVSSEYSSPHDLFR